MYIVEFEQHGEERSNYGDKLIPKLVEEFKEKDLKGLSFTNLNLYRQFYMAYPEIEQIFPKSVDGKILQSVTEESVYTPFPILQSVTEELEIRLLVTNKNEALVEYATAGMDQNLFVSKYLLQLPDTEKLESFIRKQLENI